MPPPSRRDQRVILEHLSWDQYAALVRSVGNRPALRLTFLDDTLEIMTTSPEHEYDKTLIARLIEAFADTRDIPLIGCGSATWKRKAKKAGLEADECYFFGRTGPRPDLAIEVVKTGGGIDKLKVYQRLGIPEVWFWVKGKFHVFRLGPRGYHTFERSSFFPDLDLAELGEIVRSTRPEQQPAAVRAFRASLRGSEG
jgi:Uma2 family endonuclease